MIRFTIDWQVKSSGRKFTTEYTFDGCGNQKGFDLIGWAHNVLRYGQKDGFKAIYKKTGKYSNPIALVNPADYPDFAAKLFQSVTNTGQSLPGLGCFA